MFWRFGVAPVSTLTTLLEKPDITTEDVLNEPDLLQECKTNNQKLIAYLQQTEVLQRLLDYVIGAVEVEGVAGDDTEEKVGFKYPYLASEVLSSEIPEVSLALFQNAQSLLMPFWDKFLSTQPDSSGQPVPLHAHPLTSATYHSPEDDGSDSDANVKTDKKSNLRSAEKVTYSGRTHGPGHTVLAGYWAKVNMMLLEKHPQEMMMFVKSMPAAVEGLVAQFETPAVVDLLFRLIQCEDSVPDAGIIEWFAENDLIARVVALLSPHVSTELHKAASEFLKAIISLSAPSPSSLNQITIQESFGGPGEMLMGAGGVNNLLVRELASEENVTKMTCFMLDFKPTFKSFSGSFTEESSRKPSLSMRGMRDTMQPLREIGSSDESAVEEDDDEDEENWQLHLNLKNRRMSLANSVSASGGAHRDSSATVRPTGLRRASSLKQGLSQTAITSAFINCASVFIELIRKNNSDYFEQHLFHTLRNYLLLRQQELSGQRHQERMAQKVSEDGQEKPDLTLEDLPFEDDDDADGMEEAMAEVAEKMGIVHLGPLLKTLSDRIPDLQEMMKNPKLPVPYVSTTLGQIEPLTHTRYCIAELYAEMLHCSNMILLNREPNVGPQYSPTGSLLGGIEGLQKLARTLQGDDGPPLPEPADTTSQTDKPTLTVQDEDLEEEPHTSEQLDSDNNAGHTQGRLSVPGTPGGSQSGDSSESDGENGDGDDDNDAHSIASALSSMSLADLTAHFTSRPPSVDDNQIGQTAGDYLKKQLLDFQVIPTLVELFLNHPWNNFLHNVVYDILQQLFNGDMDTGINKRLTISTFTQAGLIDAILEGSRRNQESSNQLRHIRLGYMGHLNLIAEEVVKLLERYPMDVGSKVESCFHQPDWDSFVNEELRVSRAKESMPLAGGRPTGGGQAWGNENEPDDWYAESEGNNTFARYLSSQMRNESTEDDEAEESDMLAHMSEPSGLGSFVGDEHAMEDSEWGPFADSNAHSAFDFISTGALAGREEQDAKSVQENLTPADWAAEFRRDAVNAMPSDTAVDNDSDSDSAGSGLNREDKDSTSGTDSDDNGGDDSPYVDLHKPASFRQRAQSSEALPAARNPEVQDEAKNQAEHWPAASAAKHARTSSSGGEDKAPSIAMEQLPDDVEQTKDGLLRRKLSDGTTVTVPLDDAELAHTGSALDISDD